MSNNHPRVSTTSRIPVWNLIALSGYSFLGITSRLLTGSTSIAISYWPAAGLAVGLCVFLGHQILPGIFVGSIIATICYAGKGCLVVDPLFALIIASAASVQCMLTAWYLNRNLYGTNAPSTGPSIIRFLFLLGPIGSSLVALTYFIYSLLFAHSLKPDEAILWWLGDSIGSLVLFPIVAVHISPSNSTWHKLRPILSNQLLALFVLPLATATISKLIIQQSPFKEPLGNTDIINHLAILLTSNELLFVMLGLGFTISTSISSHNKTKLLSRSSIAAKAAGFVVHEANQPLLRLSFIVEAMNNLVYGNLHSIGHSSAASIQTLIDAASIEVQSLGKITKSMVDLAISGARDTHEANVVQAIRAAVAQSQSLIDDYNISLGLNLEDTILPVLAGKIQLQTAIRNILANACRAADQHGVVRIQAYNTASDVKIVIEDSGPGLQESLAMPDVGITNISTTTGMGIGLTIVRIIMDSCNGSLELGRSSKLGGASISLSLPIDRT